MLALSWHVSSWFLWNSCQKSGRLALILTPAIAQGHCLGQQASHWPTPAGSALCRQRGWTLWCSSQVSLALSQREQMWCKSRHLLLSHVTPSAETKKRHQGPRAQQARSLSALQGTEISPVDRVSDGGSGEPGKTWGSMRGWEYRTAAIQMELWLTGWE